MQEDDESEEDHILTEYRLSSLTWKFDSQEDKINFKKGTINHLKIAETFDDSFKADSSAIFLPAFPKPDIIVFDFIAPLYRLNL